MSTAHAVAKKNTKNDAAASRNPKNTQVSPEIIPEAQTGLPEEQSLIQRKENACPCGGSCPKCLGALGIQAKLKIGAPNDKYEQEADRVADQVMRMPEPAVQRQPEEEEEEEIQTKPLPGVAQRQAEEGEEEEELIQTKANTQQTPTAIPGLHTRISALKDTGQPLSPSTRAFFEPRFGRDFSRVHIHTDSKASETARSINAKAFTVGRDVVFGAGQYALGTTTSRRLLAHELTHVIQQDSSGRARIQRQVGHEPDAGVPLPAGVVDFYKPRPLPEDLADTSLGEAYEDAEQLALSGDPTRLVAVEDEIIRRLEYGAWVPRGASPRTAANTAVTPDVALKLLDNMSKGKPPFRSGLGKGGASWFVTEGTPYTSVDPSQQTVKVDVEIQMPKDRLVFREADLSRLLNQETNPAESEAVFRRRFGFKLGAILSSKMRKSLAWFQKRFAESRMWDQVAAKVKGSPSGIGEVVLEKGSNFSKTPGKFAVVTEAAEGKVQLKAGTTIGLVDTLTRGGVGAEPVVVEAAEAFAKKMKWAGRVRGVFHYGGRILIVAAITMDILKIYRAKSKLKAVVVVAGGWTGAIALGSAFAAWFTPADTAGPLAWVGHGVGTLVAGGVGYWIGSETTLYVYELIAE